MSSPNSTVNEYQTNVLKNNSKIEKKTSGSFTKQQLIEEMDKSIDSKEESDHKLPKKRAKFTVNQVKLYKGDKSNASIKSLENNIDPHTKGSSSVSLIEVNETPSADENLILETQELNKKNDFDDNYNTDFISTYNKDNNDRIVKSSNKKSHDKKMNEELKVHKQINSSKILQKSSSNFPNKQINEITKSTLQLFKKSQNDVDDDNIDQIHNVEESSGDCLNQKFRKQKSNDSLKSSKKVSWGSKNFSQLIQKQPTVVLERLSKAFLNENHKKNLKVNQCNKSPNNTIESTKLAFEKTNKSSEESTIIRCSKEKTLQKSQYDEICIVTNDFVSKSTTIHKNAVNLNNRSYISSVETSCDDTIPEENQNEPIHPTASANSFSRGIIILNDVILTPNAAQSSLHRHDGPITDISYDLKVNKNSNVSPSKDTVAQTDKKLQRHEDIQVNVLINVTSDNEESQSLNENEFLNHTFFRGNQSPVMTQTKKIPSWLTPNVKKKLDTVKKKTLAQMQREDQIERKREREKTKMDSTLNRFKAKLEAESKKKDKKPIDKAYFINGKLYKQPRLPKPRNWVTDKLYKHLWQCMESKYGPRKRIMSEKFVIYLSKAVSKIEKQKKYNSYKEVLDDLLITMAKHNIIKTRYDFYRFCSDYMPYNFRVKVVPMQLPGNKKNIPYNPSIVFKSILDDDYDDTESEFEEDE